MIRYSIEPRTRQYVKVNELFSFVRNLSDKNGKLLLNY